MDLSENYRLMSLSEALTSTSFVRLEKHMLCPTDRETGAKRSRINTRHRHALALTFAAVDYAAYVLKSDKIFCSARLMAAAVGMHPTRFHLRLNELVKQQIIKRLGREKRRTITYEIPAQWRRHLNEQNRNWLRCPRWVLSLPCSWSAMILLSELASQLTSPNEWMQQRLSTKFICDETGLDERSVASAKRLLEQAGYIKPIGLNEFCLGEGSILILDSVTLTPAAAKLGAQNRRSVTPKTGALGAQNRRSGRAKPAQLRAKPALGGCKTGALGAQNRRAQ